MKVQEKERPTMRLAYMRRFGAYGPECVEVWGRILKWARPAVRHDVGAEASKTLRMDSCVPVRSL